MIESNDSFKEESIKITQDIFNLCTKIEEMPNANLMFVECKVDGKKFILIIKLNYKTMPMSLIEENDGVHSIRFINQQILPNKTTAVEEAIIIDDKENLRQLLLTVLRGDISKSINTVTKALNSSDSEASHYAASAIMDIMNEFQTTLQKFHAQLETDPNDKEVNQLFIEYLIKMLNTNFLSDMELKTYIYSLAQTCQDVYDYDKSNLKTIYYSGVINLLVKIDDIQTARIWVSRLQEEHPNEIETYRCVLRFYYLIHDKEQFFYHMDRLKKSDIPIDKDLLELIRIYN